MIELISKASIEWLVSIKPCEAQNMEIKHACRLWDIAKEDLIAIIEDLKLYPQGRQLNKYNNMITKGKSLLGRIFKNTLIKQGKHLAVTLNQSVPSDPLWQLKPGRITKKDIEELTAILTRVVGVQYNTTQTHKILKALAL